MDRRRMRLEINGVLCGVITQESDEYMNGLAKEVGELMQQIQTASPYITREAAALTVALGYCDDAKKNGRKAAELSERAEELEVEVEIWQEETERAKLSAGGEGDAALLEKLKKLEQENTALEEAAGNAEELRRREKELADENESLRRALAEQPAAVISLPDPQLLAQLEQLKEENEHLMESSSDWMEQLRRREKELTDENEGLRRALAEQPTAETSQPDPQLLAQLEQLKMENEALEEATEWMEELRRREKELTDENESLRKQLREKAVTQPAAPATKRYRENPLRSYGVDDTNMSSFFAK